MENGKIIIDILTQNIFDKINHQYYAKIPKAVDFEHITHNPDFLLKPLKNVALYSDHGLNHVINVAEQIPIILKAVHGIHIPMRDNKRLEFIQKYGIVMGFIHDIGMSDMTTFGREMHGEFAAQEIFTRNFRPILNAMWEKNIANIPWTLLSMHHQGIIKEPPEQVFRELLSLACCHRKFLVPVEALNNPHELRKKMHYFLLHSLHYQYHVKIIDQATKSLEKAKKNGAKKEIIKYSEKLKIAEQNFKQAPTSEISNKKIEKQLAHYYKDFTSDSFNWLFNKNKLAQVFISDVIDTLRILRCSDALRQRGTDLKTSAQFQIFANQFTANAIYALTNKIGQMYFLELDDKVSSSEANVASMFFTNNGDLRIEFNRGFFHSKQATEQGISSLASLIIQLDHDIFNTFVRPKTDVHSFRPLKRPKLLLETTDDATEFTNCLAEKIIETSPHLKNAVEIVPSLKNISQVEYQLYINGKDIDWSSEEKRSFLKKISSFGYKIKHIDISKAFKHTRIVEVKAKEMLCEAKTFSGLVYFPFTHGLEGVPTGSYSPFKVSPFTPLGSTGVIRGGVRNSTIIAKKCVKLLAIPKSVFLNYWLATYSKDEFVELVKKDLNKKKK